MEFSYYYSYFACNTFLVLKVPGSHVQVHLFSKGLQMFE